MNTHIKELAARREGLVVEAQLQRAQAAHVSAEIRAGLGIVDRGVVFVRDLIRKPLVVCVAAAALALLVAKPRQAVRLLGYCLTAYSVFQRVRRLLATSTHRD
jgi:YqjK-like protein